MFRRLCCILLLLNSRFLYAEAYKCQLDVRIIYQDKPCQTQATQQQIFKSTASLPVLKNNSHTTPSATPIIQRDAHGRIKRSEQAKNAFKMIYPCPATGQRTGSCNGYVIDHIQALACGGADHPSNMQWQTVAAAKAKDVWERKDCRSLKINSLPEISVKQMPQTIYTGSRGGRYVFTRTGKKRYLPRVK